HRQGGSDVVFQTRGKTTKIGEEIRRGRRLANSDIQWYSARRKLNLGGDMSSINHLYALPLLVALLLMPVGSVHAATARIRPDRDASAEAAVKTLELQLCDLLLRGDWRAYASPLTDDYVPVLPGKIQNRAEVLQEFRTPKDKIISMVPKMIRTRI